MLKTSVATEPHNLTPGAQAKPSRYGFVMKLLPSVQGIIDSIMLLAAGLGTFYWLVPYSYKTADMYYYMICFNWLLALLLLQFGGLYSFDVVMAPFNVLGRILLAVMTTLLMIMATGFALNLSEQVDQKWFAAFGLASAGAVCAGRITTALLAGNLAKHQFITRRVAILGEPAHIEQFIKYAERLEQPIFSIVSIFVRDPSMIATSFAGSKYPVQSGIERVVSAVRADFVDDVVLAFPWSDVETIKSHVETLRDLPVNVLLAADLAGYALPMARPSACYEQMSMHQLLGTPQSGWGHLIKLLFDVVIASILLIVLAPLFIVVAILIKLDSKGPVFFRQPRLGFNNHVFDIYKFRSMTHRPPEEKTVQASPGDVRVTRIGKFLRTSSIDELPQLFNVLNGTMSLVGPRPHAVDHNEDYARRIRGYFARHKAKPGITGLAQIKGFRGVTDTLEKMEQRVRYDVEYIENWSPWLDMKVLLFTPLAVLFAKNAH